MMTLLPAEDWRPSSEGPLGKRAPQDWNKAHYTVFPGRFEPVTAYANICRLLNHADRHEEDRQACLAMAGEFIDLTVKNSCKQGSGRFIVNNYDLERRNGVLKSGWVGSIGNGFMLRALCRMYMARPSARIEMLMDQVAEAYRVVNTPERRFSKRWFTWANDGYIWFDEYPQEHGPTMVLNGHIHGLWGLLTYNHVKPTPWAEDLIQGGLFTMRMHVDRFRVAGRINAYAIHDPHADYAPRRTVRQQLELFRVTGDPWFERMAELFESDYQQDPRLEKIDRKYIEDCP